MASSTPALSATPPPIIQVEGLSKAYPSGFQALQSVDLNIQRGEIFALLGPNGAGKTTLISILCGLLNPSAGRAAIGGHDVVKGYRQARQLVGLVPQELTTDTFETVWNTIRFSRGLFGCPRNDALLEQILRDLTLWDKRHNQIRDLSGGMKRRLLIAKALSHEPRILFLDEPTAGVDVELRRDMWEMVRRLREQGVTIILTTHYIEEAEEMADRIGVIRQGKLLLVKPKQELMAQLGRKQLHLVLAMPLTVIPAELSDYDLSLNADGTELVYTYSVCHEASAAEATSPEAPAAVLKAVAAAGIEYADLYSHQSSLEEIFVDLLEARA